MGIFGAAQYHPEADSGWDNFSNLNWGQEGDWSGIAEKAKRLGYNVWSEGERMFMWKHENDNGWFFKNGGQSLACEFLGGVA
jgi:hypothetical protein